LVASVNACTSLIEHSIASANACLSAIGRDGVAAEPCSQLACIPDSTVAKALNMIAAAACLNGAVVEQARLDAKGTATTDPVVAGARREDALIADAKTDIRPHPELAVIGASSDRVIPALGKQYAINGNLNSNLTSSFNQIIASEGVCFGAPQLPAGSQRPGCV
jgi:hypothetical protein